LELMPLFWPSPIFGCIPDTEETMSIVLPRWISQLD